MNDAAKEYNGKNTCTNKVCNSFWFGGSWNLVILNFRARMRGGEGGRGGGCGGGERGEKQKNIFWGIVLLWRYSLVKGCPIGYPFKLEMQDFKYFQMP